MPNSRSSGVMISAVSLVVILSLKGFMAGSFQSWLEAHWLEAVRALLVSGMVSTARVSAGRSCSGDGVAARSVITAAARKVARETMRFITISLRAVLIMDFQRLGIL